MQKPKKKKRFTVRLDIPVHGIYCGHGMHQNCLLDNPRIIRGFSHSVLVHRHFVKHEILCTAITIFVQQLSIYSNNCASIKKKETVASSKACMDLDGLDFLFPKKPQAQILSENISLFWDLEIAELQDGSQKGSIFTESRLRCNQVP